MKEQYSTMCFSGVDEKNERIKKKYINSISLVGSWEEKWEKIKDSLFEFTIDS